MPLYELRASLPALVAIYFNEEHADWVSKQMTAKADELGMSTVNLAEVLILLKDRKLESFVTIQNKLLNSSIRFFAPDTEQAQIAAEARLRYPPNLGDCFAYVVALGNNDLILTLDSDFSKLDIPVIMPRR